MENSKFASLCLFLPTGRTFTFREVEVIINNESVLAFDYKAMSDGLSKTMVVEKHAIIGYSYVCEG